MQTYKKAVGRGNLEVNLYVDIDQTCAETIYKTMTLPIFFILRITWSWLGRHPKKSDKEHWTTKFENYW